MQKKYKMTGCARFFIVLLILAPLAYIGASYYNGQDGIQNIKNLFGIGKHDDSATDTYKDTASDLQKSIAEKDKQINSLQEKIKELQEQNDKLKGELDQMKKQQDSSQQ